MIIEIKKPFITEYIGYRIVDTNWNNTVFWLFTKREYRNKLEAALSEIQWAYNNYCDDEDDDDYEYYNFDAQFDKAVNEIYQRIHNVHMSDIVDEYSDKYDEYSIVDDDEATVPNSFGVYDGSYNAFINPDTDKLVYVEIIDEIRVS